MRIVPSALALALSAMAALTACAPQSAASQTVPPQDTVRLCDSHGCADVPRHTATFQGAPSDPEAAQRLQALITLAEQNPKASYDLGLRFLRGDGVERNSYQAIQWMRRAGEAGHIEAQYALGRLYLLGFEEMGADPVEAEGWLTRTAAKGYRDSKKLLADAQAAKQDEQRLYRIREEQRKSWSDWYSNAPYFWVWRSSGWHQR